jgi:DNA-binding transcriptional regulator GbsR (MarR family)
MIDEIHQKTKLSKKHIQQIIRFLKEFNFMIEDKKGNKIKLDENFRRFLIQTATP